MKNILRIVLALLLTPAYALADDNIKPKEEKDEPVVEEAKEND